METATRTPLRDFSADSLTLRVSSSSDGPASECISLVWLGKANMRYPMEVLGPYFDMLVTAAEERGNLLEFHFETLEHLNSSTILALMRLVQTLRQKRIRLRIFFDAAHKWQKMTFEALRQLDRNDGLFEFRGSPSR
jgi:hypothetical protein